MTVAELTVPPLSARRVMCRADPAAVPRRLGLRVARAIASRPDAADAALVIIRQLRQADALCALFWLDELFCADSLKPRLAPSDSARL